MNCLVLSDKLCLKSVQNFELVFNYLFLSDFQMCVGVGVHVLLDCKRFTFCINLQNCAILLLYMLRV